MDRRSFLVRSSLTAGGMMMYPSMAAAMAAPAVDSSTGVYELFRNPSAGYRPFVRWWWNGNKIQADELVRELQLLKSVGIGGVEINPVKFPEHDTDDMGIPAVPWLSDKWIELLEVAFTEAKRLGMICDLIVGSGWPFGGEFLKANERGQIMECRSRRLEGPQTYETSEFSLLKDNEPKLNYLYSGRQPHLVSLKLVPEPVTGLDGVINLDDQIGKDLIRFDVPKGKWLLYSMVRVDAFEKVIEGAPGASGPILNHFDKGAVAHYLNRMSDTIQAKIGPLSNDLRALFTDSMELFGANWVHDFPEAFRQRNGYDVMPWLPFIIWQSVQGSLPDDQPKLSPEFQEQIERMRYDVEVTKAEMFRDRFHVTYVEWCHSLKVKARAQAYGQGFFPLESSMMYDIPEGESWTTNWLQHRIGEEMSNEDYRRGRSYTMVNKYVSSGGHLSGKRLISCEEMTNTYRVFNMTLEFLKLGCDMNAMAGITHSIFHGFNYSPANAPFPGWIRYGAYYNERNNWWPYFHYVTEYRARISALLQNADMYADIAILPPVADMWTTMGMQNEPFPAQINAPYQSLLWEAMNKSGNGTDYLSDSVIRGATVKRGKLCYGTRSYSSLFLIEVERLEPATLEKILEFVVAGGRVFCIEKYPHLSLGWNKHEENDRKITELMDKLKAIPDRFILLKKPEDNNFVDWYPAIQKRYALTPSVTIAKPNPYFMVNRYTLTDGSNVFFFVNCHLHDSYTTHVTFPKTITAGRYPWVWNPETGERYRLTLGADGGFDLYLGHAGSLVVMFDRQSKGKPWKPLPVSGAESLSLTGGWDVELRHSVLSTVENVRFDKLADLKDTEYVNFSGTVVYRKTFTVDNLQAAPILNLGKVCGVSEVLLNGENLGITWYGDRLYALAGKLRKGSNSLEVRVVTTMGNYVQTLADTNKIAQHWTARPGRTPQPKHSMGLVGPVTIYGG